MSWIRSSRGVAVVALIVCLLAAAGTAGAVSVEYTDPNPVEVGSSVQYIAAVEEPFRDAPDQWTLKGETGLENATWTIQVSAQGDPVETRDFGGENFTYDLSSTTGATVVDITVSGDIPPIPTYNYDARSSENMTLLGVSRVSDGNENALQRIDAPRYTEESREARNAIDSAIESVGDRNDKIEQAISAYDTGNFQNAISLAEEAEGGAQSGQLLLYGAVAVVVILVIVGGVYYWRQRRDTGYKLQ